jgi:hypothetical protein
MTHRYGQESFGRIPSVSLNGDKPATYCGCFSFTERTVQEGALSYIADSFWPPKYLSMSMNTMPHTLNLKLEWLFACLFVWSFVVGGRRLFTTAALSLFSHWRLWRFVSAPHCEPQVSLQENGFFWMWDLSSRLVEYVYQLAPHVRDRQPRHGREYLPVTPSYLRLVLTVRHVVCPVTFQLSSSWCTPYDETCSLHVVILFRGFRSNFIFTSFSLI